MPTRLRLVKVKAASNARTKSTDIAVELMLGRMDFVGHCSVTRADLVLQAIAIATFDAVNQALINVAGASFQIKLESVEKLYPEFLTLPLVVVIVNVTAKSERIRIIGSVLSEDDNAYHATAAAALDAINRQVDFILGG